MKMKTPKIEQPVVRKTQEGFSKTLCRLKVGHIVLFEGFECKVVYVSDCRARIVPLSRKAVCVKTLGGAEINFERPQVGYNISPNSAVEIVRYEP